MVCFCDHPRVIYFDCLAVHVGKWYWGTLFAAIRELTKVTGTGVATVHKHLNELICGGYIKVEQPRRLLLRVVKGYGIAM